MPLTRKGCPSTLNWRPSMCTRRAETAVLQPSSVAMSNPQPIAARENKVMGGCSRPHPNANLVRERQAERSTEISHGGYVSACQPRLLQQHRHQTMVLACSDGVWLVPTAHRE